MDKKRILKDFFIYSAGNYISQGLGIVSGFLLRVFLSPYYMGIWQGLNIIKTYTSYTNLGVSRSAAREIAYFRGKQEEEKAEVLKNTGFTFSAIMITIVGAACIIYGLLSRNHVNKYIYWGFMAVGVIVILERLESYIISILRAKKKFFSESLIKVINSVLNLALILLVVRHYELLGLYASHIILFTASILLLISIAKEHFKLFINRKELKHLIKIGVPLVLMGVMFVNLTNVDRLVILKMLGAEKLGLYSVAIMMGNLVYNISNMAAIVLYPRFQEAYGKTDSKEYVFNIMKKMLKTMGLPLILLIVAGVFLLPYTVRFLIPKYIGGINAMKIFLFGIYFLSMAKFCSQFLVTINRQVLSLIICVVTVGLNLVLNILFVSRGYGIEGVAGATSLSYLFYFVALYIASLVEIRLLKQNAT